MSWVEKNRKINNRGWGEGGGGTIIRDSRVSVLYDKIPVFYALKLPKFTTITFCPLA